MLRQGVIIQPQSMQSLLKANKGPKVIKINSYITLNLTKQYSYHNDQILNEIKTQQTIQTNHRTNNFLDLPEINQEKKSKCTGITTNNKLSWKGNVKFSAQNSVILYAVKRITIPVTWALPQANKLQLKSKSFTFFLNDEEVYYY